MKQELSSDAAVHVYLGLDGGVFCNRWRLAEMLVVLPSGLYLSDLSRRETVEDTSATKKSGDVCGAAA